MFNDLQTGMAEMADAKIKVRIISVYQTQAVNAYSKLFQTQVPNLIVRSMAKQI